jgi:hypothetical protein
MIRLLTLFLAAAAIGASACSSNTPTTPTTPASTGAITPATTVLQINQQQTYTLTATTTPTTVTWTSSDTSVMTIDSGGTATALKTGAATITATGDAGQTGTLTVQVVPIYQGNWAGTATVLACTDLSGFSSNNYCARNLGAVQPVTLTLTQSGLTLSGTMSKAEGGSLLTGNVTGVVGIFGDITLTGTLGGVANGANYQLGLVSWNSLTTGSAMTGNWSANITSPQVLGIATLQWSLSLAQVP